MKQSVWLPKTVLSAQKLYWTSGAEAVQLYAVCLSLAHSFIFYQGVILVLKSNNNNKYS